LNTIDQFNYWDFAAVNPLRRHPLVTLSMIEAESHRYLSELYWTRYMNGDPEAIFAYMAADRSAFEADWVQRQIRKWQDQDTPESNRDALTLDAPKGALTDGLRQAVHEHKPELLRLLA